jgi:alpha-amylase
LKHLGRHFLLYPSRTTLCDATVTRRARDHISLLRALLGILWISSPEYLTRLTSRLNDRMGKLALVAAAVASLGGLAAAGPGPAEWASRSIYQVMTDRFARSDGSSTECTDIDNYCGGTWTGLINNLDYIQGMGFTAVQISPVVENIKEDTGYGEAYHGYWVNNFYGINENFGTAGDLSHLSQALHDRGMYLMVDVVINNMAQAIDGSMPDQEIDYSKLIPFNDEKYYHKYCNITDYDNDKIAQECWLGATNVALPDLATESQEVADMIGTWITGLVANYSIDGLRIDAAKHVNDDYLPPFVEAAGIFTFGEIYSGVVENVCKYQKNNLIAAMPNFPIYFPLIQAFTNGNMKVLSNMISDVEKGCTDTSVMGIFAENHDLPRFASLVPDLALAKNAIAFTILADGIPTSEFPFPPSRYMLFQLVFN